MNREAAALGVPVYTTYGGRLGGVDEQLIREGRLRPLTDPRALDLHKRDRRRERARAPRPAADARPAVERAAQLVAADDGEHLVAVALELDRADARQRREIVQRAAAACARSRRASCCRRRRTAAPRPLRRGRGATRRARGRGRPSPVSARTCPSRLRIAERRAAAIAELLEEPARLGSTRSARAPAWRASCRRRAAAAPRRSRRRARLRDGSSFSSSRGRKTASNSSPFARCSVSRCTPLRRVAARVEAAAQVGDELAPRCRRSSTRARRGARGRSGATSSRSPSLSGSCSSQPASSAARAPLLGVDVASTRSSRRSSRRAASRSSSDAPWNGMRASCSSSSKSVRRAFVRARIAIRSSGAPSARISATIAAPSASGVANGAHDRLRPVGQRRAQHLLGAAELRDEPVRELEHLRRRAVVLLEPDDESRAGSARGTPSRCSGPAPVNA